MKLESSEAPSRLVNSSEIQSSSHEIPLHPEMFDWQVNVSVENPIDGQSIIVNVNIGQTKSGNSGESKCSLIGEAGSSSGCTVEYSSGRGTISCSLSAGSSRRPPVEPPRSSDALRASPDATEASPEGGELNSSIATFWDALSRVQREAFVSAAHEQVFLAGSTLMREGERGDYVAVILAGRVKICVHDSGSERTVAELGPGELVGERAALHLSVRSATVIALEQVKALVMKTRDFTTFVEYFPAAVDILENQIYRRLTRRQDDRERDQYRPSSSASTYGLSVANLPGRQHGTLEPRQFPSMNRENCTIIVTDIVSFSSEVRNDRDRLLIREASAEMTITALGDSWQECFWENCGDGLLLVIPPKIPTATILEQLIEGLPPALSHHNRIHSDATRIQLRLAATVGPVVSDKFGMCGEAIIFATRLAEAPALKQGMTKSDVNLGVIASGFVYETVVRQSEGQMGPANYKEIPVNVKECNTSAWIQLI